MPPLLDVLKIDESFVEDAAEGNGPTLARTIVALGKTLSLQTVTGGVERPQLADALSAIGCGIAQGLYCSKPARPANIDAMLRYGLPAGRGDTQAA